MFHSRAYSTASECVQMIRYDSSSESSGTQFFWKSKINKKIQRRFQFMRLLAASVDAPSDRALRRAEHRSFRLLQKRRRVLVRKEARIASEVSRRNRVREGRAPWMCVVHARMQLCAMVSLRSRTVTEPPPPPPPLHTRTHAHTRVSIFASSLYITRILLAGASTCS